MFLAFARDRLPSRAERTRIEKLLYHSPWNGPRIPRLQLGAPEQDWFALFILDAGATLDLPAFADGDSERNLLASAKFMNRVFRSYTTGQIRNLVRCLARRTAFVMSEAVSNTIPDRFALPPPPVETPVANATAVDTAHAGNHGFARLLEQPAPAREPLAATAPPRPARRRNTLWTNAQPFAVDAPTMKPANEDPPHVAAE